MRLLLELVGIFLLIITKKVIGGTLINEDGWMASTAIQPEVKSSKKEFISSVVDFLSDNEDNMKHNYSDSKAAYETSEFWDEDSICDSQGLFPLSQSCRHYYQCIEMSGYSGLFTVWIFSCPMETVFDDSSRSCKPSHLAITRSDCEKERMSDHVYKQETSTEYNPEGLVKDFFTDVHPLHSIRTKRSTIIPVMKRRWSNPLIKVMTEILGGTREDEVADNSIKTMKKIESKLEGIYGRLTNVQISVLDIQVESRTRDQILKNLLGKRLETNEVSFAVTQNLISNGILDNHMRTAEIIGLISNQGTKNERNFARVQVSLGNLIDFIKNETASVKNYMKKGFQSIPESLDLTKTEPIVSKMLTLIKKFNEITQHIRSISEENRIDAIKRSGGYLDFLKANTIKNTLVDIIQQDLAIPNSSEDLTAVFILDLLVQGLQVHENMMSLIVYSKAFLAAKALEKTGLTEFDSYMLGLNASITMLKSEMESSAGQGLISDVKDVLQRVQKITNITDISGIDGLLYEKNVDIENLEADVESLIEVCGELRTPGSTIRKLDFTATSAVLPIGSWKKGKRVSYAIQHMTDSKISRLGEWSAIYVIENANPIIEITPVPYGIVRVVYRKFDLEKPECIAVIKNNSQTIFKDINYDLLKAVAQPKRKQAIRDITALIENGADVNHFIGSKLTPLHNAAKHGNVAVMKILINSGANINARTANDETPLHFAALRGIKKNVDYLITKGARINAQTKSLGLTPLHIAAANSHVGVTRSLLRNGALLNLKDNNGLTPLHMSVTGNGDTTDVLLRNATMDIINAMDDSGLTPLHYAARSSNVAIIMKLLSHRDTDLNPLTNSLLSPLHFAAMTDNVLAVLNLLRIGESAKVYDDLGSTPLHYAAFYSNENVLLVLMIIDQSLKDIRNNEGKLPLDLANGDKKSMVVKIIQSDLSELKEMIAQKQLNINITDAHLVAPLPNCTSYTVDDLGRKTAETCLHMKNIDTYVDLVMKMIPLGKYYDNQGEYEEIFRNYDKDLTEAQKHAKIWRNGDSIVSGIKETFELTRKFEPEFRKKYNINKKRVGELKQTVHQINNETIKEINNLEEELVNATRAQELARYVAPSLLNYFSTNINRINNEIKEKKRKLDEDLMLLKEGEELVAFLEFVRRDSNKILAVANKTKDRIEIFRDHLFNDKCAFERHGEVANETLEKLKKDTIKSDETLIDNKKRQDELEKKMETKSKLINDKYKEIEKGYTNLTEIRRNIIKKMRKSKDSHIVGALISAAAAAIPFAGVATKSFRIGSIFATMGVGTSLVGSLLSKASEEEKNLIVDLKIQMEHINKTIELFNSQMITNKLELAFWQEQMANSTSNSEKLRNELNSFIPLKEDLKGMAGKVETLLDSINKALAGISFIKGVFGKVTKNLTDMIDLASTAKTEAEKRNAKYFAYHGLDSIACNFIDVYINVISPDECTRSFEMLNSRFKVSLRGTFVNTSC